jgi:hypothetical protein
MHVMLLFQPKKIWEPENTYLLTETLYFLFGKKSNYSYLRAINGRFSSACTCISITQSTMAILQPQIPLSLYPHHFHLPLHSPTAAPFLCTPFKTPRKPLNLTCSSKGQDVRMLLFTFFFFFWIIWLSCTSNSFSPLN